MVELATLFFIPLIFSLAFFILPKSICRGLKSIAFFLSSIPLILLILGGRTWLNASWSTNWIPPLGIQFHLAIDSLSLLFIYLTAIIIPISILSERPLSSSFYGLIFLLQGLLIGFFAARDLVLFLIFFEAILIPLYFIISLWGKKQRYFAAMQFIIYMLAGSALLIAAVLGVYFSSGSLSFDLEKLAALSESSVYAPYLFAIFMLAFAVKTPLFPFHGWLPDAYYEAPIAGSILLAGLLSKAGIYGILRVVIGLFPNFVIVTSPLFLGLAIAGTLYGGLVAWRQTDYKKLIAYSSFSHVNFILAGLFIWQDSAHAGAILQAFNHGITITALFLTVGWLEERTHTTQISEISGLAKFLPRLAWLTLIFVLSSVALPGTNNFIGEILILLGLFGQNGYLAALLGLTVILSVVYMLRFMQKVYFEKPILFQESWIDLRSKEIAIATPLLIIIFFIGIYPTIILKEVQSAATKTLKIARLEKL